MISDGDTDALYDAICEYERNTVEVFDLFNDEELSYDITDENGAEVESGTITVSTSNIFSYEDPNCETIVNSENHPEYLLIVSDVMKRSSSTF